MFLGRNTQQWMGLFTAVLGFVATIVQLYFPAQVGPFGILASSLTGLAGIVIAFVANQYTTPVADPQLQVGTVIRATNDAGIVVGHVKVPVPEDAPVAPDVTYGEDGQAD